jgi:hypothetical protein
MDPEIQAAQDRLAQPGETVEVEQPEAAETVVAEGAAEGTEPTAEPTAEPVVRPTYDEERMIRLERQNAELMDQVNRLAQPTQAPVADVPPPPPPTINTPEELQRYMEAYAGWREDRLARRLTANFRQDAASVAAEQRARGLFSRDAMGEGRDYDMLVAKHIAPVEQSDPTFRAFFNKQADPAVARYVTAAVLEVIDSTANGDPVKGVANLWAALEGKASTAKTILKQVKDAAEGQVGRTGLRPSRAMTPSDRAQQIAKDSKSLSVAAFAAKYPKLITG